MSTFRPGQRVRVIRAVSPDCQKYVGKETHITGPLEYCSNMSLNRRWLGHPVALDPSGRYCPSPENLEPIIPSGHKRTTWDKCLWQPEGVAV